MMVMAIRPNSTAPRRTRRLLLLLTLATFAILLPFALAAIIRGDFADAAIAILVLPIGVGYVLAVVAFAAYVLRLVISGRADAAQSELIDRGERLDVPEERAARA